MSVDELAHIGKPFDLKIKQKVCKLGWYFTIRSCAVQGQPVKGFKGIQKHIEMTNQSQ